MLPEIRRREQERWIRLRTAEEIPEESPLRQKLVPEYFERCARTGMWPERKILHRKLAEHRRRFVDLARVSIERVLQQRVSRRWNPGFGNHTSLCQS